MRYEGTTYRPPVEMDSVLLQVTVGCAHNTCTFCNMYHDVLFRRESLEHIEEDLQKARDIYPRPERVFLLNGDAFVLQADYLKKIAHKVKEYLPVCETITMYASIQNIVSKTDEELKELRALGINDLYVGIESGKEDVAPRVKKGWTIEEAKKQLARLEKAQINHTTLLMLGIAGKGQGQENAKATAAFLNETKPSLIWVGTLRALDGAEITEQIRKGTFVEASEMENLLELKTLIENITLENVPFYAVHPTNLIPVMGRLPRDKESLLKKLDEGIKEWGEEALSATFKQTSL